MPIACFGEMLWDMLPTGRQPGGAPLNVAVHLHNFGLNALIISRIGHDDLGAELRAFVESKNISTHYVQHGETHLTGVVKANVSNTMEVTYQIVKPVAWDYIQYTAEVRELVETAEASCMAASRPATHPPAKRCTGYCNKPASRSLM
ncbi:PfkB family carbohydrate kinase [Hymenobacter sp. AT01-02]|uniref:PfkB family carbohydrate kinase n=1 Tax=Hymenobacter sp. AT01-02 TaxID=1571877 RepID=UPI000B2CE418|nr:PfkB family carbohydrate kinase [Hymenobacter sp. AT01-02]